MEEGPPSYQAATEWCQNFWFPSILLFITTTMKSFYLAAVNCMLCCIHVPCHVHSPSWPCLLRPRSSNVTISFTENWAFIVWIVRVCIFVDLAVIPDQSSSLLLLFSHENTPSIAFLNFFYVSITFGCASLSRTMRQSEWCDVLSSRVEKDISRISFSHSSYLVIQVLS